MWLVYALFAAIAFGVRGSLYHWTSTLGFNRNVMLCGVFVSGAIINAVTALSTGAQWNMPSLIGVQMGLFSFAASACMYQGFAVGKPSLIAMLTALPPVVVVFVAYLVWDEQLHLMQWIAFIVLVFGILVIRYSNDLSWKNMQGAQWGILTMLFFAANDLSTKWSTLEGASMFPTLCTMFLTGSLCFALLSLIEQNKHRKQHKSEESSVENVKERKAEQQVADGIKQESFSIGKVKQRKAEDGSIEDIKRRKQSQGSSKYSKRRTFSIGLAVGTTNALGMILSVQAFDLGMTGLVSAILAMNAIVILLYTRFVVKTPFTRLELGGMCLAFVGVLLIQLFK